MFGLPVPGYLHPMGWQRPAGNRDFVVTRGCLEHVRSGVGCALDIGNGLTGAPVSAMAAGTVYERYIQNTPGQVGHGALILRVRHANGWTTGYAHLQSFSVGLNATVAKGQQIGVLGATGYGISGPHLHTDAKLNGVARDLWALLDINELPDTSMGDDDVNLKGTTIPPLSETASRMQTTVISDGGTNLVVDPTVQPYVVLQNFGKGKTLTIDWQIKANAIAGSDVWYGLWNWSNPPKFGYIPSVNCGPLVAIGGDTTAAYNQGVAAAALKATEAKK